MPLTLPLGWGRRVWVTSTLGTLGSCDWVTAQLHNSVTVSMSLCNCKWARCNCALCTVQCTVPQLICTASTYNMHSCPLFTIAQNFMATFQLCSAGLSRSGQHCNTYYWFVATFYTAVHVMVSPPMCIFLLFYILHFFQILPWLNFTVR